MSQMANTETPKPVLLFGVKDMTTSIVMEWINHLGGTAIRVNSLDEFRFANLHLGQDGTVDLTIEIRDQTVGLDGVHSFWRRKVGKDNLIHASIEDEIAATDLFPNVERGAKILKDHLEKEASKLEELVYHALQGKPGLGNHFVASTNKLMVLQKARSAGLDIPDTMIGTRKSEVRSFLKKHRQIITKAIGEGVGLRIREQASNDSASIPPDKVYLNFTRGITEEDLDDLPDTFFPTLFQEQLDKDYELRIFYLDGTCYSMAIFSQLDGQTQEDFRNYNRVTPNRNVPFKLPKAISDSICTLMDDLELKTGSIDLIATKDGRCVFLEVNPSGQFGMVSTPCNYYLEKKVAEYLLA